MTPEPDLLRHFIAALAYRTQKALRGAPQSFSEFRAAPGVRTPRELVRHMTSVLGYANTFFVGGAYKAVPLESLDAEVARFHATLEEFGASVLRAGPMADPVTPAQLLQGPLADAMTHAGQLALLRRLAGSPVPPENFLRADISADNLTANQAAPASPGRRDGTWDPRGVVDDSE